MLFEHVVKGLPIPVRRHPGLTVYDLCLRDYVWFGVTRASAGSWVAAQLARNRRASSEDIPDDDWRKTNPRFTGENFQRNLAIVDQVQAVAAEAGATPAQIALAWLLAQGNDIAPIPGTRRLARVEKNTAADGIQLSDDQLARLSNLTPASGERHDEANMASIDR